MVSFNYDLAKELGLETIDPKDLIKIFNGEVSVPNSEPLAMAYAGHQFGNWVPQLGDGRESLFGQIKNTSLKDLHIKGAGKRLIRDLAMEEPSLGLLLESIYVAETMHGLKIPSVKILDYISVKNQCLEKH